MAPNRNQSEAWNGGESVHYVTHADRYDRQLAPFTEALLRTGPIDAPLLFARCGLWLRSTTPSRHQPSPNRRSVSTSWCH